MNFRSHESNLFVELLELRYQFTIMIIDIMLLTILCARKVMNIYNEDKYGTNNDFRV